jgi:hypothetical protein
VSNAENPALKCTIATFPVKPLSYAISALRNFRKRENKKEQDRAPSTPTATQQLLQNKFSSLLKALEKVQLDNRA